MPRIRAPFGVNCLSRRYFLLRKACSWKPQDRKLSWYRKSVPVWHFVPLEFEAKAWKSSQKWELGKVSRVTNGLRSLRAALSALAALSRQNRACRLSECRGARGLSPSGARLTRPLVWRATRLILAALIAAIVPQPSLTRLRDAAPALHRNLREPPRRKRQFQQLIQLP
jgi:hypothetical protein